MRFFKENGKSIVVFGIIILLIVLIGLSFGKDHFYSVKNVFHTVFTPVMDFFSGIGDKAHNVFYDIRNFGSLNEENEMLWEKLKALEEENRELKRIIDNEEHLKKEYQMLENKKYDYIEGDIVSREIGSSNKRFIVNIGKKDGVKKNDTVVVGVDLGENIVVEGIVGRVSEVFESSSKIISIMDGETSISFVNSRNAEGGMVDSNEDGLLMGFMFDESADVVEGDKIFSSGLGEVFKKDLYIGEVKEVKDQEKELLKRIIIEPSVDFNRLMKVFVIRG